MFQRIFTLAALSLLVHGQTSAQSSDAELEALVRQQDSLFWDAYNHCQADIYPNFITEDLEFYHDKGGSSAGMTAIIEGSKTGMCNPGKDFRLRRKAIPATVQIFPMQQDGQYYAAIISGEHIFYIREKGQERLDGHANFTHLWVLRNGVWKMSRVFSYNHRPAGAFVTKASQKLDEATLKQYVGAYKGGVSVTIMAGDGVLIMYAGTNKSVLHYEADGFFFMKERAISFQFVEKDGKMVILVNENGQVVDEMVRQ